MKLKLIEHSTGYALAMEDGTELPGQRDVHIDNRIGGPMIVTVSFVFDPATRATKPNKEGVQHAGSMPPKLFRNG